MSFFHSSTPSSFKLGFALAAFTTLCLLYATLRITSTNGFISMTSPPQGAVVHIVMFQYKPAVTASVKNDISSAFIALKDSCRLPDGSKYILSLDGGLNNSPEGRAKGLEHAFVVTFRSAEERDYYLDTDPAHDAFKTSVADKLADATIFDFSSGEFAQRAAMRKRRPSDEVHVRTV